MGCGILICEWIVRGTLLMWISIPSSGVTRCLDLKQKVYDWVERPSQATGCTKFLKI
jgi:hypothetical protein